MAKAGHGHTSTGGTFAAELWLIKPQPTPIAFGTVITGVEFFECLGFKIAFTTIIPFLEIHLHDLGNIIGIAENPRVAAHPTLHGSTHIMHISLNTLVSIVIIFFRWHNLTVAKNPGWIVSGKIGPQRLIKM